MPKQARIKENGKNERINIDESEARGALDIFFGVLKNIFAVAHA